MALAHCILGKFLGVVCHCFPPPLDVPTFAARCLYVRIDARDPSSERWNCGRERCPVILLKFRLPRKFRDLLHAANLFDHISLNSSQNGEIFQTNVVQKIKTHILRSIYFFFENLAVYEIMWKNIVESGRPQMKI